MNAGKSVESTMGFTALDGLAMGTRPGQLDPGVVLYLIAEKGMSAPKVQDFLYRECGLKGLSGVSNDMRELEASSDPRAAFAIAYFVYRIGLNAGMLAAALQGLDAFVFTAGIGENAMECSRKSSWPHSFSICWKTFSVSPSTITSSGRNNGDSSAFASGSTCFLAFSFR